MTIRSYEREGKILYEVYVNSFDNHGQRHQFRKRGIEDQRQAKKIEFEFLKHADDLKDKPLGRTWSEWHAEVVRRMCYDMKPGTVQNYDGRLKKWVNPQWGDRDIGSITKAEVYELIYTYVEGLNEGGRKTLLKLIRRVFQIALEDGLIDRNPAIGIKVSVPQNEQAVLTGPEAEKFLREANTLNHKFYPIWAFALLTGMRSGEMYALRWTDIDFDNRIIKVSRNWIKRVGYGPTKTGRVRVVPICADLEKLLKELLLKRRGSADDSVLPRPREWTMGMQSELTRQFCGAIKVTSIRFHDLRATFITNLLAKGVPLAQVMAIVGHTQLKTTTVYLRLAGVEVQGATEHLSYSLPQNEVAKVINLSSEKQA